MLCYCEHFTFVKMAMISKQLFYERIDETASCDSIHYFEPNCLKCITSPWILAKFAIGSGKFFFPIYMLKLLINYKRITDKDFLKSLFLSEIRSASYGVAMAVLFACSMCSLRKTLGRFYYYSVAFLPGVISGLSLLVESEENKVLDTLIFFNSFVEAIILNLSYYNIFTFTSARETIAFMAISAILMHLLENRTRKINSLYFWFYTPPRRKASLNKLCNHLDSCSKFFLEGFFKYFSLGYIINIVRKLLPKAKTLPRNPLKIFGILFNKGNCKFGLFVGAYVGLYRILTCYLARTAKIKRNFHGFIAGLFAGLTYAISPNIQVLIVGITTVLQVLYEDISCRLKTENHFWPRQLLFMLCQGVLIHNKLLKPDTCPVYYDNMINACSGGLVSKMRDYMVARHFL